MFKTVCHSFSYWLLNRASHSGLWLQWSSPIYWVGKPLTIINQQGFWTLKRYFQHFPTLCFTEVLRKSEGRCLTWQKCVSPMMVETCWNWGVSGRFDRSIGSDQAKSKCCLCKKVNQQKSSRSRYLKSLAIWSTFKTTRDSAISLSMWFFCCHFPRILENVCSIPWEYPFMDDLPWSLPPRNSRPSWLRTWGDGGTWHGTSCSRLQRSGCCVRLGQHPPHSEMIRQLFQRAFLPWRELCYLYFGPKLPKNFEKNISDFSSSRSGWKADGASGASELLHLRNHQAIPHRHQHGAQVLARNRQSGTLWDLTLQEGKP